MSLFIMRTNSRIRTIQLGFIACWLLILGEWLTDFYFATRYPGYRWQTESISYLGQRGSPVELQVTIWGACFTLLLVLYAYGFWQAFRPARPAKWSAWLIVMYGLGEGAGSGFFPMDPPGSLQTASTFWHELLSSWGDAAIITLPLVWMYLFRHLPWMRFYLKAVIVTGLILAGFFLAAKWGQPPDFILNYKGLWQRIYVSDFHVMLGIGSILMLKRPTNTPK